LATVRGRSSTLGNDEAAIRVVDWRVASWRRATLYLHAALSSSCRRVERLPLRHSSPSWATPKITISSTGIPVFHVDERNGRCFLPNFEGLELSGNSVSAPAQKQPALPMEDRDYGPRVTALIARYKKGPRRNGDPW